MDSLVMLQLPFVRSLGYDARYTIFENCSMNNDVPWYVSLLVSTIPSYFPAVLSNPWQDIAIGGL